MVIITSGIRASEERKKKLKWYEMDHLVPINQIEQMIKITPGITASKEEKQKIEIWNGLFGIKQPELEEHQVSLLVLA